MLLVGENYDEDNETLISRRQQNKYTQDAYLK